MGTRHLIAVIKDGTHKIAQYGQWDGYPSGQGKDVIAFLENPVSVALLREGVDRTVFIDNERYAEILAAKNAELAAEVAGKDFISIDQASRVNEAMPTFDRDLGAEILQFVAQSTDPEIPLFDRWTFGYDSLFCEWAYVIDLDADQLEIYMGFQERSHTLGRWSDAPRGDNGYYGVRLIGTWGFDDLPTMEILQALTTGEDDEDGEKSLDGYHGVQIEVEG